eukprot:3941088-Rhodomonas_salina.1
MLSAGHVLCVSSVTCIARGRPDMGRARCQVETVADDTVRGGVLHLSQRSLTRTIPPSARDVLRLMSGADSARVVWPASSVGGRWGSAGIEGQA